MRIKTDDLPETLARLTIRLADLECRILAFTRHSTPEGILDDLVLCPATGLPPHLVVDAINDEGGECLGLTETTVPDAPVATANASAANGRTSAAVRSDGYGSASHPAVSARTGGDPAVSALTGGDPAVSALTGGDESAIRPSAADLPASEAPDAQPAAASPSDYRVAMPETVAELLSSCDAAAHPADNAPADESGASAETDARVFHDAASSALVAARQAIADPDRRAQMLQQVLAADFVTLVPAVEANPGRTEGGHRAVFRFGDRQAFVARRRWAPFAGHEIVQGKAFLDVLAEAKQNLAGPVVLSRPDGAAIVLRLGTPRDVDAIGALHSRCSAKTLFSRYHTGLRTVPRRWLHRLLLPPRGSSLLAVCGRDVVGFGQLIFLGDRTAEVSLLVEDAWQRQGIGTALLARLADLAAASGITELSAVRLPSNDAMIRTARCAGLRAEPDPADSTVLRLVAADDFAVVPRTGSVSGSRTSLCPEPRAAPASSAQQ
ncbi:GNAT family N-acetyltransferase [Amycolatopsis benzoatilytica]|uniref:GNAT family N-acetyltransferase n=1 Tax=Amycolatopsis benzoatilytica TaxID=346045 RepID=UPI000369C942|nr:GNAT family N-acetyltransferase [Amycolatopsis benzoatilytica]